MSSEKEFKDNLKEKLNEKQFSFDEANWLEASKLIDASREEKKRRPFPFFLVSGLALLVSVFCFYIFKPAQKSNEVKLAVKLDSQASQPVATSENDNVQKNISKEKVNSGSSTQNTGSVSAPASVNESIISETKEHKTLITSTQKTVSPKNLNERKEFDKKVNSSKRNSKAAFASSVKSAAPITHAAKSRSANAKTLAIAKDELQNKNTNPEVTINKNHEDNNQTVETSSVTAKTQTPVAEVNSGAVAAVPVTAVNKPDSTKNTSPLSVAAPKDSLSKNFIKQPVHFISIEAGATYLFGWTNPGAKDGNGFNPLVGLNYTNSFSKKTSFSIGAYYTSVQNLSYSNYVVKKTHYDFGEENDVIVFTPTTLHYVVAPLRLSYSLNSKNQFGLGCNVGYLFNVKSTVEFYSQHAGKKEDPTILKTSGYMQGFKSVNTQLSVFYRRSIAKDFWLHAELMYGLSNVKDNTFFKTSSVEKNTGLKVTLIYNLFKK